MPWRRHIQSLEGWIFGAKVSMTISANVLHPTPLWTVWSRKQYRRSVAGCSNGFQRRLNDRVLTPLRDRVLQVGDNANWPIRGVVAADWLTDGSTWPRHATRWWDRRSALNVSYIVFVWFNIPPCVCRFRLTFITCTQAYDARCFICLHRQVYVRLY